MTYDDCLFDFSFPRDYEFEYPTEPSGTGRIPQWYYPKVRPFGGALISCLRSCRVINTHGFACISGGRSRVLQSAFHFG